MMDVLLAHVRPAVLRVLLVALFLLSASAMYLYGFKGALKQRGELRESVAALADSPEPQTIQQSLDEAREQAASEARQLAAATAVRDVSQINTRLMAGLEASASGHRVRLLRVVPGAATTVRGFEAQTFQVEASGGYGALYAWLREVEQHFQQMPIAALHIEAGSSADQRLLRMTLVSHRVADDKPT